MKAPLSWLKEYVDITLSPKQLGERLTEIGLGTEKIAKIEDDIIFEFEITPNRPDLLSIVGIAREIAAVEGKKIKLTIQSIPKPTKKLPLTVHNDFSLLEHYSNIIISGITIKDSPDWLKKRLIQLDLRPINNIVDITNYVMFELGIPLHAFDYDEIHGKEFFIEKSKGGEKFTSVDKLSYILPKDAIIIKDADRIVDLVGIKGGLNSGIKQTTKNVLLQTSVDNPALIRRASQALSLRSDASSILERGIDKNGLLPALSQAANLILDTAGGQIASNVIDLKKKDFSPWKLTLRLERLRNMLGITLSPKQVVDLLDRLNLSPKLKNQTIETAIPTYRNDLKIEEDLIEEVARLYGYNNFPKTLAFGEIPIKQIPYFKDYKIDKKAKQILQASGFSEIYTYSLLSEKDLVEDGWKPEEVLRVDNPVSKEFEYLRPTLRINIIKALRQNRANFNKINLYELGKVYRGKTLDQAKEEYELCAISNEKNYYEMKGIVEYICNELGTKGCTYLLENTADGILFYINLSEILEKKPFQKSFIALPKYPPIIEDLAIIAQNSVPTGDIIEEIKRQSLLIANVDLLDQFEDTRTFHIVYQHREKTLTTEGIANIRSKILKALEEKFNAKLKK